MFISFTEFQNNLEYYLLLSATEDVFITKDDIVVAKLANPNQDRMNTAKSLLVILPTSASLTLAKTEYLSMNQ